MAINVTLGEARAQEVKFPKLMTLKEGGVFYFTTNNSCLCLDKQNLSGWENGEYYSGNNLSEAYIDFNKSITIQNA